MNRGLNNKFQSPMRFLVCSWKEADHPPCLNVSVICTKCLYFPSFKGTKHTHSEQRTEWLLQKSQATYLLLQILNTSVHPHVWLFAQSVALYKLHHLTLDLQKVILYEHRSHQCEFYQVGQEMTCHVADPHSPCTEMTQARLSNEVGGKMWTAPCLPRFSGPWQKTPANVFPVLL